MGPLTLRLLPVSLADEDSSGGCDTYDRVSHSLGGHRAETPASLPLPLSHCPAPNVYHQRDMCLGGREGPTFSEHTLCFDVQPSRLGQASSAHSAPPSPSPGQCLPASLPHTLFLWIFILSLLLLPYLRISQLCSLLSWAQDRPNLHCCPAPWPEVGCCPCAVSWCSFPKG